MALGLVWLAVASGAIVMTEPAPVDVLTIGLIVLLPVIGLVAIKPSLVVFLSIWLAAAAAAFGASAFSSDIARSSIHSGISVYLYLATFVFAAFAEHALAMRRTVANARPFGAQPERLAGGRTALWVIPNSSGLASGLHRQRLEQLRELAATLRGVPSDP